MEKFKSLFEYLGKPAGKELGGQVFKAASGIGIPIHTIEIDNRKYSGRISTYPENWLIGYFQSNTQTPKDYEKNTYSDDLPY
jgi:hypothetical protein